ncbi:signal peptidase I [Alkalicoccus chagannorensis]|uniref:signal peptidase I n=1 Tax=Alkalicoccus chagannorensis TaxID=427072 RepID=UPI0004088C6F|nr:signal peptidase I [Alkalicoccus chagannorensis]
MGWELRQWLKVILFGILIVFVVRSYLFIPIVVDGQSMLPTLEHDNRMIVNKFGYQLQEPDRFDIVVFHADETQDYIKRVIGLPGDHIRYERDQLYVDHQPVEEEFLLPYHRDQQPLTHDFQLTEVTGHEVVPEGHVFVLGDNRRHSKDSRHIGFVSFEDIVGEANVIFWPFPSSKLMN